MENEFSRLGQLIFDLNLGKQFDLSSEDNFRFLDEEFTRITLAIGMAWKERQLGWTYYLDYHAAEGERLLQKLRMDKDYRDLLHDDQLLKASLIRAYKMLFHILTELLKRIDLLQNGKNIALKY